MEGLKGQPDRGALLLGGGGSGPSPITSGDFGMEGRPQPQFLGSRPSSVAKLAFPFGPATKRLSITEKKQYLDRQSPSFRPPDGPLGMDEAPFDWRARAHSRGERQ
jgi:hypothetical protein